MCPQPQPLVPSAPAVSLGGPHARPPAMPSSPVPFGWRTASPTHPSNQHSPYGGIQPRQSPQKGLSVEATASPGGYYNHSSAVCLTPRQLAGVNGQSLSGSLHVQPPAVSMPDKAAELRPLASVLSVQDPRQHSHTPSIVASPNGMQQRVLPVLAQEQRPGQSVVNMPDSGQQQRVKPYAPSQQDPLAQHRFTPSASALQDAAARQRSVPASLTPRDSAVQVGYQPSFAPDPRGHQGSPVVPPTAPPVASAQDPAAQRSFVPAVAPIPDPRVQAVGTSASVPALLQPPRRVPAAVTAQDPSMRQASPTPAMQLQQPRAAPAATMVSVQEPSLQPRPLQTAVEPRQMQGVTAPLPTGAQDPAWQHYLAPSLCTQQGARTPQEPASKSSYVPPSASVPEPMGQLRPGLQPVDNCTIGCLAPLRTMTVIGAADATGSIGPVPLPTMAIVAPSETLGCSVLPPQQSGEKYAVPELPGKVKLVPGVEEMAPEAVNEMLQKRAGILVDVRGDDRSAGIIEGSVHEPAVDTIPFVCKVPELVKKWADEPIVVFTCQFSMHRAPSCANDYRDGADKMQRVAILYGGFRHWEGAGLPVKELHKEELAPSTAADDFAYNQGLIYVQQRAAT